MGITNILERLCESDAVDTITLKDLVKLSWSTPQARRIVLQNFTACAQHELTVKQGQKVNYIYRDSDWAYVVTDDKKEGYIPFTFLAKIGVQSKSGKQTLIDTRTYTKKTTNLKGRNISVASDEYELSDHADDQINGKKPDELDEGQDMPRRLEQGTTMPMLYEFYLDKNNIIHKCPVLNGLDTDTRDEIQRSPSPTAMFKVLYNFTRQNTGDIDVRADDIVFLLDDVDPNWYWVRRLDGEEGYIPSNYITQDCNSPISTLRRHQEINNCYSQEKRLDDSQLDDDSIGNSTVPSDVSENSNSDIPVKWKVTDDLKGKIPSSVLQARQGDKKQTPKKPPRKKKAAKDMTDSRNDSMESFVTLESSSSIEHLDRLDTDNVYVEDMNDTDDTEDTVLDMREDKREWKDRRSFKREHESDRHGNFRNSEESHRDKRHSTESDDNKTGKFNALAFLELLEPGSEISDTWTPRSNAFSESSVIDSSYDDVFGSPLVITESLAEELSPRSKFGEGSIKTHRNFNVVPHMHYGKENAKLRIKSDGTVPNPVSWRTESFGTESSYSSRRHRSASRRPRSIPALRSYQEYQDYFDEYYYDESDKEFVKQPKQNVVNVGEILKLRDAKEQRKSCSREGNEQNGVSTGKIQNNRSMKGNVDNETKDKDNRRKASCDRGAEPQIKEFLFQVPHDKNQLQKRVSYKRNNKDFVKDSHRQPKGLHNQLKENELQKANTNEHTSKVSCENSQTRVSSNKRDNDVKNASSPKNTKMRQYNSATDLRYLNEREQSVDIKSFRNDAGNEQTNTKESTTTKYSHIRPYSSSNDLRDISGKNDWSFGYPRKVRKSIGRVEDKICCHHVHYDRCEKCFNQRHSGKKSHRNKDSFKSLTNRVEGTETVSSDKGDCSCISNSFSGKTSNYSDEDAMMALLSETANLLDKTDKLLDVRNLPVESKETEHSWKYPNTSNKHKLSDRVKTQNIHNRCKSTNDRKEDEHRKVKCDKSKEDHHRKDKTESSNCKTDEKIKSHRDRHESDDSDDPKMVKSMGNEKCSQFLNNCTIGIHGMTYIVQKITDKSEKEADSSMDVNTHLCDKMKRTVVSGESDNVLSLKLKDLDLNDIRGITEFVSQCNYDPKTENGLPIRKGEIIHIGLDGQDNDDMYWAFSPRLKKYGFVPKDHVKIPLVTII